jgi:hypothetical protein
VLPRRRKKGPRDCFGRTIPADFRISFRRDALAEALWEYGEDELAEPALALSDEDLHEVHRLAVWHHVNDPDPKPGPKLTNARVSARAAIEFFERTARDTARQRRRTRPVAQRYTAAGRPDTPAEGLHYEGWERD